MMLNAPVSPRKNAATSGMLIVRSGVRWFASGKYTGNVTLIAASRSTLVRSSDSSENR